MQIVELEPPFLATVEVRGVRRKVSTVLVSHETLEPGNWLMIHVGSAIGKIDETSAQEILELLESVRYE